MTLLMVEKSDVGVGDVCEYDGDVVGDIVIVGKVVEERVSDMHTLIMINDNTNYFPVVFYHKGENEVPHMLKNFKFERLSYAKIYGTIRVLKDHKAIIGTFIKKVDKFDEITNHFLTVFMSYQMRKKGQLKTKQLIENNLMPNYQADSGNNSQNGYETQKY